MCDGADCGDSVCSLYHDGNEADVGDFVECSCTGASDVCKICCQQGASGTCVPIETLTITTAFDDSNGSPASNKIAGASCAFDGINLGGYCDDSGDCVSADSGNYQEQLNEFVDEYFNSVRQLVVPGVAGRLRAP